MQSSPGSDPAATGRDETEDASALATDPTEPATDDLQAQLEQMRAELAATEDRHLRARADLENYRKRVEQEIERRVREQADELLRDWLDVVDSVERALTLETEQRQADALRAFLEQMEAILARQGVRRIGEVGDRFDPGLHEAVAVVPSASSPAGTIAEIARSGYSVDDRVVRPTQVAVARSPGDSD
jgi:molecular chaperone GrpE